MSTSRLRHANMPKTKNTSGASPIQSLRVLHDNQITDGFHFVSHRRQLSPGADHDSFEIDDAYVQDWNGDGESSFLDYWATTFYSEDEDEVRSAGYSVMSDEFEADVITNSSLPDVNPQPSESSSYEYSALYGQGSDISSITNGGDSDAYQAFREVLRERKVHPSERIQNENPRNVPLEYFPYLDMDRYIGIVVGESGRRTGGGRKNLNARGRHDAVDNDLKVLMGDAEAWRDLASDKKSCLAT
ncbi:hypothetical protein RUND412_001421 [Rhizina undulata]